MKYGIGQILTLTKDIETTTLITETKKTVKKGTEFYVMADKRSPMAMQLNGKITLLPKDAEIEGFSAKGISKWLYMWLRNALPIDEMMEDYDIEKDYFIEKIENALEELSFYDHEGNID